jgi:membrane protease subunit HflC
MSKKLIAAGVAVIALGILGLSSIFTVKEAEQAIVLELGRFVRLESKPGLHFKLPFIQNISYFDRRVLDFEADLGEINTSDQKQTLVDTYTRYRITDALRFFQTARSIENFEARRDDAPLNAIIKSNVRQVISRVDLATLLTAKRAEVMKDITKRVHGEMERFGVEILDVRLKRIDLPQQNADAVQQRMETQRRQEAIRIRAEGDKESQTIRADADKRVRVIRAEAEQKANILRGEGEGTAQDALHVRAPCASGIRPAVVLRPRSGGRCARAPACAALDCRGGRPGPDARDHSGGRLRAAGRGADGRQPVTQRSAASDGARRTPSKAGSGSSREG